MLRQAFIFEYLIAGNLILQVYADLDPKAITWSKLTFDDLISLVFLILVILKYYLEGNRINSIIYVLFQIIAVSNRYLLYNYLLNFTTAVLAIMYCYSIYYFPVYTFPNNTGQYRVGYKTFKVADTYDTSVFYPTRFHTHDTYWAPDVHFWENIYEASKIGKGPHPPKLLFKFITSHLQNIHINVEVNSLLEENKDPYNIIIFSHGLAGSMNSYSIIASELASHGYIVFCPNHKDEVFINTQSFHELRKQRTAQLINRSNNIKRLIDFLYDKKTISRLFFQNNVQINYETLSIAGHAFGGTTAIFTAFNDARIRGGCLCLDPWMWPIPDELLSKGMGKAILNISSEKYWRSHLEFENDERLDKLFRSNRGFKGNALNLMLKSCSHYNFSDLPNLMPRENVLWKLVDNMDTVHDQYKTITKLLYHFLASMDIPDGKIALIEKFKEDCGKIAADEDLVVKN